jgi:excisionase family DNA binding protein
MSLEVTELSEGAMSELSDLLDIKQAAQLLQVSETSLRRWTNAGRLACLRVGRRRERRFRRADLLAFLEEQPARAALAPPAVPGATDATTIAGISVPFGSHLVALYSDDAGRANLAAAFLADGLGPGSVCYLVTTPEAQAEVLNRLARSGAAVDPAIGAGRLVVSEHTSSVTAQCEYFETQFRAATRAGARSLRLVGDVSAFAAAVMRGQLVELEAEFDRLIARRFPVVTLCTYDARRHSSLDLFTALQAHQDTFRYPVDRLLA